MLPSCHFISKTLKLEFNKNKLKMEELYKKTANKLEYNGIYNVCLEILKEIK